MKKRTVGIYAKYDASEQTLCALAFTNYIVTRYRYVAWFTPDSVKQGDTAYGFSHQWDTKILPKTNPKCSDKIKGCDTFFFFEPETEIFKKLPPNARTAFIINPHVWNDNIKVFAKNCTYSLLLSPDWLSTFSKYQYLSNLLVWPFDPTIAGSPLRKSPNETNIRLFYPVYGFSTLEKCFVKQVADLIRLCRSDVKSVIGCYNAKEPAEPGYDSRVYDWRLHAYLQNSDWIIDLNPQPLFGYFPSCAGNYGLRWLGFNIPPYTDSYSQTRKYPITTKTKDTPVRTLKAIPDAEDTAVQIIRHLETVDKIPSSINYTPGSWERRSEEFLRVTNLILGVRSRH
jgi:hypothetical protein